MDQEETTMDESVIENIRNFTSSQNLKKTALIFIASRIPEEQIV